MKPIKELKGKYRGYIEPDGKLQDDILLFLHEIGEILGKIHGCKCILEDGEIIKIDATSLIMMAVYIDENLFGDGDKF